MTRHWGILFFVASISIISYGKGATPQSQQALLRCIQATYYGHSNIWSQKELGLFAHVSSSNQGIVVDTDAGTYVFPVNANSLPVRIKVRLPQANKDLYIIYDKNGGKPYASSSSAKVYGTEESDYKSILFSSFSATGINKTSQDRLRETLRENVRNALSGVSDAACSLSHVGLKAEEGVKHKDGKGWSRPWWTVFFGKQRVAGIVSACNNKELPGQEIKVLVEKAKQLDQDLDSFRKDGIKPKSTCTTPTAVDLETSVR